MQHLKEYILSSQIDESMDDFRYNIEKTKAKWKRFWNWFWGEDDEDDYYDVFSDNYDDDKFDKEVLSEYNKLGKDEKSKVTKMKWTKVDKNVPKNMTQINKILDLADINNEKGFWKTKYMLEKFKLDVESCEFAIGNTSIAFDAKQIENASVLITVHDDSIKMIDIMPKYETIVDWKKIHDYVISKEFLKDWFSKDIDILPVILYKSYENKEYENQFKFVKHHKSCADFDMYKTTIQSK